VSYVHLDAHSTSKGRQNLGSKRSVASLAAAAAVVLAGSPAPAESGQVRRVAPEDRYSSAALAVPGELLVELAPDLKRSGARPLLAAHGGYLGERVEGSSLSVVEIDARRDVFEAAKDFRRLSFVRLAEPNLLRFVDQNGPKPRLPDDEFFSQLWGLHNEGQEHALAFPPPGVAAGTADADIDAPEAWERQAGSSEAVIAVLDSGVDVTHPDLINSMWSNSGEIAANGVDDDGNGFIDDVHGWDFGEDDATLLETDEGVDGRDHGTHVAGIVAAEMNNGIGVTGVCPGCELMILKGFRKFDIDRDGSLEMALTVSDEIEALAYARRMGADIVNGSYAAPTYSVAERAAIERLGDDGILGVFAAGNSSADNDLLLFERVPGGREPVSPAFPASYELPGIISVAASNHIDEYGYDTGCAIRSGSKPACAFTNWGAESVDVAAPGTDILSTITDGGYGMRVGTSMAAPHVAGIGGLVESEHPDFGPAEIKNSILNSADRVPSLNVLHAFEDGPLKGSFTKTNARVNAFAALAGSPVDPSTASDGTIGGALRIRRRVVGEIGWPEDANDVYFRSLRKGSRYKVVLVGPRDGDLDLIVYKPKARDIWQYEAFCILLDPPCGAVVTRSTSRRRTKRVEFKARSLRPYYVHVAGYFTRGPYTLRIERLPKRSR
jgi:subtilisin family serine protease